MDMNARALRSSWLTLPRTVVLVWASIVLALCAAGWSSIFAPLWFADSDDVMRLQQVHDLLGGQAWGDVSQHRLQPPEGGSMQWTRLADIGLATIIWLGRMVGSATTADRLAIIAYPALLMLGWLGTIAWGASRLAGARAGYAGLLVALTMASVRFQFAPGRIDHHALQLLGFAVALVMLATGTKRRHSMLAGAGMAVSLGTGLEALALIALLHLAVWLRWCRHSLSRELVTGLGTGLLVSTAIVVALALPPAHWQLPVSDGFGRAHAALLCGAGLYWLALAHMGDASRRWTWSGVAGLALAIGLALLFPDLRQMPYTDMDPLVRTMFLDRVQEAARFDVYWRADPAGALVDMGVALTGLLASGWLVRRTAGASRDAWALIGATLVLALVTALWQARAFSYTGLIAALPIAGLIGALDRPTLRPLLRTCLWLLPTALGWSIVAQAMTLLRASPSQAHGRSFGDTTRACTLSASYRALGQLPPGRVLSLIDLGARVIAYTPHSAIAAPYHRNERGLRDTIQAFSGTAADARQIVQADGVAYVVICPGMAEQESYRTTAPKGFLVQLADGQVPAWLTRVPQPTGSPLQLYQVNRPQSQTRP